MNYTINQDSQLPVIEAFVKALKNNDVKLHIDTEGNASIVWYNQDVIAKNKP